MEKSYDEITRVIDLWMALVLLSFAQHILSPRRCRPGEERRRLRPRRASHGHEGRRASYIAGIAAATNLASALLLEPKIAERITLIWLGAMALTGLTRANLIFSRTLRCASSARFPRSAHSASCHPVTSHLIVTVPELEKQLEARSKLGAYLTISSAITEIIH